MQQEFPQEISPDSTSRNKPYSIPTLQLFILWPIIFAKVRFMVDFPWTKIFAAAHALGVHQPTRFWLLLTHYFGRDALFRHGRSHRHATSPLPRRKRAEHACVRCRNHKARCDGRVPCTSCARSRTDCVRLDGAQRAQVAPETSEVHEVIDEYLANSVNQASPEGAESHVCDNRMMENCAETQCSDRTLARSSPGEQPGFDFGRDVLGGHSDVPQTLSIPADALEQAVSGWLPVCSPQHQASEHMGPLAASDCSREGMDALSTQLDEGLSTSMQFLLNPVQSEGSILDPSTAADAENQNFLFSSDPGIDLDRIVHDIDAIRDHLGTVRAVLRNSNIHLYFKHFHGRWPLLHKPSFSIVNAPLGLQCSIALLGSLLEADGEPSSDSKMLHQCLWSSLMARLPKVNIS